MLTFDELKDMTIKELEDTVENCMKLNRSGYERQIDLYYNNTCGLDTCQNKNVKLYFRCIGKTTFVCRCTQHSKREYEETFKEATTKEIFTLNLLCK
jgi:hypothetical protein